MRRRGGTPARCAAAARAAASGRGRYAGSRALREKPRLPRFLSCASDPAIVSRTFSPAAAALWRAPRLPPNLRRPRGLQRDWAQAPRGPARSRDAGAPEACHQLLRGARASRRRGGQRARPRTRGRAGRARGGRRRRRRRPQRAARTRSPQSPVERVQHRLLLRPAHDLPRRAPSPAARPPEARRARGVRRAERARLEVDDALEVGGRGGRQQREEVVGQVLRPAADHLEQRLRAAHLARDRRRQPRARRLLQPPCAVRGRRA